MGGQTALSENGLADSNPGRKTDEQTAAHGRRMGVHTGLTDIERVRRPRSRRWAGAGEDDED